MKFDHQRFDYGYDKAGTKCKETITITYLEPHLGPSNSELYNAIQGNIRTEQLGNVYAKSTSWNAPLESKSIFLGVQAMQGAVCSLLHELSDGQQPDIPQAYYPMNAWGVIYNKGDRVKVHNHFPCLWSQVYYVKTGKDSAPLIFPDIDAIIKPEAGMCVQFPSYLWHHVKPLEQDEDRAVLSANWIYCDSTIRDCMFGYETLYNRSQLEANMPPNPWLIRWQQVNDPNIPVSTNPSLHYSDIYEYRNKRHPE